MAPVYNPATGEQTASLPLSTVDEINEAVAAAKKAAAGWGATPPLKRAAHMTVIVHIGLTSQNEDLLEAFEKAVRSAPSVVSCHLMSGEDDYLVTVRARDLADYERIHKEQLARLPGVARLKSSFVLRDVADKPLPASCLLPSRK